MSNKALSAEELAAALKNIEGWQGKPDGIHKQFRFADFVQAMAFMQSSIDGIEDRQHHPEWSNVYNRVDITLKTHDAGDQVTAKDLELAAYLDKQAAAILT